MNDEQVQKALVEAFIMLGSGYTERTQAGAKILQAIALHEIAIAIRESAKCKS